MTTPGCLNAGLLGGAQAGAPNVITVAVPTLSNNGSWSTYPTPRTIAGSITSTTSPITKVVATALGGTSDITSQCSGVGTNSVSYSNVDVSSVTPHYNTGASVTVTGTSADTSSGSNGASYYVYNPNCYVSTSSVPPYGTFNAILQYQNPSQQVTWSYVMHPSSSAGGPTVLGNLNSLGNGTFPITVGSWVGENSLTLTIRVAGVVVRTFEIYKA